MTERRETGHSPEKKEGTAPMFGFVENLHDRAMEIREASFGTDHTKTVRLLNNPKVIENMVVRKGGGSYLKIIDGSIETLYKVLTGSSFGANISSEAVQRLLREARLDPIVLAELANTYYHRKKNAQAKQLAEALVAIGISPLVSANALNCLASLSARQQKYDSAREYNRKAYEKVKTPAPTGQDNSSWQSLKVQHGLIFDRATARPQHDMLSQLEAIADQRITLGDTLHVGRTYLDMAKIAVQLKQVDAARENLEKAMKGLSEVGYENALAQAEELQRKLAKR